MSVDIEKEQERFIFRLRGARAAGKFLGQVPEAVDKVLRLFEARNYDECDRACAGLMSEGLWVAFGQIAMNACEYMRTITPKKANTETVEVIRK
jgi:hypothetical protein